MNITLFGGSFNPPHLGHLIVIQQAFELIPDIGELWILPCYRHTFQKNLAPTKHRLAMTKLLMNKLPEQIKNKTKLCPIEIDFKLSGETYEALQKLKSKRKHLKKTMSFPPHYSLLSTHYSFLMGTDQLKDFKKWGNWQKLLEEMPFHIYPRSGYKNKINLPNMNLLESPSQIVTNLSSTLVRERIDKNQTIDFIVPSSIANYIHKNNLYR
jgi:nicotinate-nucleotide adenylyltransferase